MVASPKAGILRVMSQENLEIVTGIFEATNARDFGMVLDAYTEDITLIVHPEFAAIPTEVSGKQAVAEWFGDWFRHFGPDYRFEIEDARDLGDDRVFLVATHYGHGRASGAPVTQTASYLFTLRDSKICLYEVWGDRQRALEAAGLRE